MPSENIYEYNCLMLQYQFPNWIDIHKQLIPEENLYIDSTNGGYGREGEPHITALYGLHPEVTVDDIKQYLYPLSMFRTLLTHISSFNQSEYDVLKYDIDCNMLHRINKALTDNLPFTSDFDDYCPHMTIAYVKPGEAEQYVRQLSKPYILTPSSYKYSYANGDKEYFKI